MPDINEPMGATLFGATDQAPQWDWIDGSEKLLRQLLTIAALTFDPGHLARPLDQILGAGVVSG